MKCEGVVAGPVEPTIATAVGEDGDKRERRTYRVVDRAGNTLVLVVDVKREGHELKATLVSTRYNDAAPVPAFRNRLAFEWSLAEASLRELEQEITLGQGDSRAETRAKFEVVRNETRITSERPKPERAITRPGLALLQLVTDQGQLAIEF